MIPQDILRDEYLDCRIDPAALGFCCIYLGGSAAHRLNVQQVTESGSDWDGLGIVNSREDILNLMTCHQNLLLQLLKVDYIDGSPKTWDLALRNLDWDVISISGWTLDGSNRAIKIWSRSHLETIMQEKSTGVIGVLAHKFPRNIQSNHPIHGSGLLISQAIRLTDDISLRFEDDFITIPCMIGKTRHYSTSPALMCDLLIASREVYESVPALGRNLKARALSKWLVNSDETNVVHLLPQLYRWETFPMRFREYLISTYADLKLHSGFCDSNERPVKICISSKKPYSGKSGYQAILFEPLRKEQYKPVQHPTPILSFSVNVILNGQYELEHWPVQKCEPLASKSVLNVATLFINSEKRKHHVLETQIDCLVTELAALPFLYTYFAPERLQNFVAIDPDQHKAFYSYQGGSRLLDIRLRHSRMDTMIDAQLQLKEPYRFERWFLSIQTCMAQDIMSAYQASWLSQSLICKKLSLGRTVRPHPHYQALIQQSWMEDISLALLAAQNQLSVNELVDLPISINGLCHGSLRNQLDQATRLLDPTASHFQNAATVFGFGGGHSGNVLVDDCIGKGTIPKIKYINYSQAGFYSPLVDMTTFLYVDCFFPVLFADLCTGSLCKTQTTTDGMRLQWSIDKRGISIDYELDMSLLDRSLAAAKLEYIVRPVFKMLDSQKEDMMSSDVSKQILGNGMLISALMSRDLSGGMDVFLMNLAMGMRLAKDPGEVFNREFAWDNWA